MTKNTVQILIVTALVMGVTLSMGARDAAAANEVVVTDCGSARYPGPEEVVLFSDYAFGGTCWRLRLAHPADKTGLVRYVGWTTPVAIWNDAISSALIGSSVASLSLYWDGDYGYPVPGISNSGAGGCSFWSTSGGWFRGDWGFGGTEPWNSSDPCVKNFNDGLSSLIITLY